MPFVITGRSLSARCLPLETISFFPPWWHTSLVAASPPSQWYRTLAAVLPLLQWCPPLALAASCHLFGDDLPDPGSSLATSLVMPSPDPGSSLATSLVMPSPDPGSSLTTSSVMPFPVAISLLVTKLFKMGSTSNYLAPFLFGKAHE